MASKPENTFIAGVHRHLPPNPQPGINEPALYKEKMYNPLRGGTWDVWYSGQRDLWIEYKWIDRIPTKDTTMVVADLSALQKLWGEQRQVEGRDLAIIVGCPEGGVPLTDLKWFDPMPAGAFRKAVLSRKEIAAWILTLTGAVLHESTATLHRK